MLTCGLATVRGDPRWLLAARITQPATGGVESELQALEKFGFLSPPASRHVGHWRQALEMTAR